MGAAWEGPLGPRGQVGDVMAGQFQTQATTSAVPHRSEMFVSRVGTLAHVEPAAPPAGSDCAHAHTWREAELPSWGP